MKKLIKNKKIIFLSLIILFSIFYFLFSILPVFAQIQFKPQIGIPPGIKTGEEIPVTTEGKVTLLANYVQNFYKWSVTAIAILAVIMIMISGIQWIFAAGNPPAIQKAREQMMSAIIGLVLVLLAIPLLNLINPALVSLSTFEIPYIAKRTVACQDVCPQGTIEIRAPKETGMMNPDQVRTSHQKKCEEICGKDNVETIDWRDLQEDEYYISCCKCTSCPTGSIVLPSGYENCAKYCEAVKGILERKLVGTTYCTLSLPENCCRCVLPEVAEAEKGEKACKNESFPEIPRNQPENQCNAIYSSAIRIDCLKHSDETGRCDPIAGQGKIKITCIPFTGPPAAPTAFSCKWIKK